MTEDIRTMVPQTGVREFEKKYEKPWCVVLDSEYCSMGRMIGSRACREAGCHYYDSVILLELVPECGVSMEDVAAFENKLRKKELSRQEIISDPEYIRINTAFEKAIDLALKQGPCLIHDRTTKEEIERKGYTAVSVLVYATDPDAKLVRAKVSPLYKDITDSEELAEKIREETRIRMNYHHAHSDTVWGDRNTYDICLNSENLGRDFSAQILAGLMK